MHAVNRALPGRMEPRHHQPLGGWEGTGGSHGDPTLTKGSDPKGGSWCLLLQHQQHAGTKGPASSSGRRLGGAMEGIHRPDQ